MSDRRLYLVRHAEAADGDDPGLTAVGETQASALGARLSGRSVARILHSPRRRAARTAELVAAAFAGVPVQPTDLLDDRTPSRRRSIAPSTPRS